MAGASTTLNPLTELNMKYLTRLTHNLHDWTRPSSPAHKAQNSNAFEAIYDFGFEEWLFCERHQSEGYQYGYIEGLNTFFGSRKPKDLPLVLFTLKYTAQRTGPANRQFVAELPSWEFLSDWKQYIPDANVQEEWRDGMIRDLGFVLQGQKLLDAQNQVNTHFNTPPDTKKPLFNVRFKIGTQNMSIKSRTDTHLLNDYNRFLLYGIEH